MGKGKVFILLLLLSVSSAVPAQTLQRINPQHHFKKDVPAGNYSGIVYLGNDEYAVVSDKGETDGFYVFNISIDSITGDIQGIRMDRFVSVGTKNRDIEGIVYLPETRTVLISGETDNRIIEYTLEGIPTGRELAIPEFMKKSRGNYGFEALAYNAGTHLIWTVTESTLPIDGEAATAVNGVRNHLRITSFDENMQPRAMYAYCMDAPQAKTKPSIFAMGVSEMTALDNGSLLVLEREVFIPPMKIGSYASSKIYTVSPDSSVPIPEFANGDVLPLKEESPYMSKKLLCEWKTRISLFHQDFANYEGMCLGPKLPDGSQVVILCSDSQNQYSGVLRDWFRTLVIR